MIGRKYGSRKVAKADINFQRYRAKGEGLRSASVRLRLRRRFVFAKACPSPSLAMCIFNPSILRAKRREPCTDDQT